MPDTNAYNSNNEIIKIPLNDLPVLLPEDIDIQTIGNPLDLQKNWKNITINGKNVLEKLTR